MLFLVLGLLFLFAVYLILRVTYLHQLAENWRECSDKYESSAEAWKQASAQWERRYWEVIDDGDQAQDIVHG